jgi:hypothetical protein
MPEHAGRMDQIRSAVRCRGIAGRPAVPGGRWRVPHGRGPSTSNGGDLGPVPDPISIAFQPDLGRCFAPTVHLQFV